MRSNGNTFRNTLVPALALALAYAAAVDALLVSGVRTPCPLNPGGHIGGCSSGKAV